ncbi:MAG: Ni/Fe hydrogenase subunit alpha [Mariprofundaceae bacterium]|nr:Ni/Fe hydrogenase subunit alpha [Mariprofundaceae bacterium]
MSSRSIKVDMVARVEGEGALNVELDGKEIRHVQLKIFEPPRFFEAFLQGRHYSEVSDIVARICGICPVAYQMSAVHAFEKLFEVGIDPEIRRLRRLLYCGEWIESHALHIYMLHAPDFLGFDSALEISKTAPDVVRRGLRLKKVGDAILKTLGGRAVHPVSVCVGGFTRLPARDKLTALLDDLHWARDAAVETAEWVSGLEFPDFPQPYTFMSLKHDDEYPFNEGDIFVSGAEGDARIPVTDYEQHFEESHVAHSNALQCHYQGKPYLTGPLARLNNNRDKLHPLASSTLEKIGLMLPLTNPFHGIVARSIEMLEAIEEAIEIIEGYLPPAQPAAECQVRAGECMAATEAPRGVLYHRYRVSAGGLIEEAKIVPPTSQNQSRIEADIRSLLPSIIDKDDRQIAHACERIIRCYDPCISCATHFLNLTIDRN